MPELFIEQLREAIVALDEDKAKAAAQAGIENGIDPLQLINQGIRAALDMMGERFSSGELFLPELMLAAKAADAAVGILEPELLKSGAGSQKRGKVLMATVKGDIHDIGKNIVSLLMTASGFEVKDIGVDRSGEEILAAARKEQVDVIGLSALLTTTMPRLKEFVELLQESGLRGNFKVIVGGAPVSQEYADTIGADGYGADATHAVHILKRLIG
jgi:5-methyltetrahydrofolate--homocysteine methyltransferase